MNFLPAKLPGAYVIELKPRYDFRGFFTRGYDEKSFADRGLHRPWVQENHSRTIKKGTIRGLHFQYAPSSETKLVRVIRGAIWDVFVDLRPDSPTLGQWDSVELTEDNNRMVYIPKGFAHGFCSLTDNCDVLYKVDHEYAPAHESGIRWNDAALGIPWPVADPVITEKDRQLPAFDEYVAGVRHNADTPDEG